MLKKLKICAVNSTITDEVRFSVTLNTETILHYMCSASGLVE